MSTEQTTNHTGATGHTSTGRTSTGPHPSKAELEAEIGQLRHSVGETVEELTYRLDVKSRTKDRIRATPPAVPIGVAVALAAGIGLWLWRRHAAGS